MPAATSCPDLAQLRQLALGQAADAEALEQHVAQCPRCGEAVTHLDGVDPLIEAIQARTPAVPPADRDLVENLVGRLKVLCPPGPEPATEDAPPTPLADETPSPHRTRRPAEGYAFLVPPQAPDEIGRLGPYRVLNVVGRGGMGVVFRAEDPRVKRVVALKVLLDGRCADPHYLARFQAEAEAVARLRHPNIVQLYEAGEHEGRPYLVLEYVEGGSLAERLAGRPQPPRAAAELTAALAGAVHHAHERGVIHRDLKPANVLLQTKTTTNDTDDTDQEEASHPASVASVLSVVDLLPKIADFGLAKRLDEEGLTQTGDLLGTPGYMAPELTRGGGSGGPAADVYGLGAILYELLSGRPPFRGETVADTLEQVRTLDPVPPRRLQPKVPRDLETVCLKCLEKEPARRYASARELADDLGRFLRGEPTRARPVSARERLWKWARRKPALAALLAVSGLSVATLVVSGLAYNVTLRAAVRRAEAKEAEARRQYQDAHATLDHMLDRLKGQRLEEVPRLKELQRDLLEDALAFYQGVLQQADSPDPAVRQDTAVTCRRAADIQQMLGQCEPAAENYRRAVELMEGLPAERRDAPDTQVLLAGCYLNWGTATGSLGRSDEAERHNRTALDILERLAPARPEDQSVQSELARAEHGRGAICHKRAPAEAEPHYARAVTLRTALVRDHPEEKGYQAALAEDYQDLGLLYRTAGRHAEASAAFAKAEDLLRPLVDGHPAEAGYALSLVAVYVNWSYLLAGTGRSKEALDRLDRAVGLAEAALRKEPQDRTCQQRALSAHGARAEIDEFLGRFADSVKDWDRVVELTGGSAQPWCYARARVLARAGDHARAAAAIEAVAALPETTDEALYGLAGYYVLAIKASRRDTRLSSAEREAVPERYASAAVALLRKLHGQGYFEDAAHARALRTDEDWQPLRGREDFRRLLAAVGNK